jgi:hypothetical protein
MEQESARHAPTMAPVPPADDDPAETMSCNCDDPDVQPGGVCGRCFRLMWQTGSLSPE